MSCISLWRLQIKFTTKITRSDNSHMNHHKSIDEGNAEITTRKIIYYYILRPNSILFRISFLCFTSTPINTFHIPMHTIPHYRAVLTNYLLTHKNGTTKTLPVIQEMPRGCAPISTYSYPHRLINGTV